MTVLRFYLWSHRILEVGGIIVVALLFAWSRRDVNSFGFENWRRETPYPVVLIAPLLVACAAVAALVEPFGDLERTLTNRLWAYRGALLASILVLTSFGLIILLSPHGNDVGMAIRNLLAMTGFTSFVAVLIGARLAWLPASLLFMIMYLGSVGASLQAASYPSVLWQWPLLPATDTASLLIAAVLSAGIPLLCWKGPA